MTCENLKGVDFGATSQQFGLRKQCASPFGVGYLTSLDYKAEVANGRDQKPTKHKLQMNAFKCSAVALALVASISASAMTSIREADLAQVSGQDGVSIIADLNVNIGAFTYTDDGASVSFNNIDIKGMLAATIDVLTDAAFQPAVLASLMASGGLAPANAVAVVSAVGAATGYTGQDVVQFALPGGGMNTLNITVASITTGHGGTSMGGIQIKNLDMQGTKMWMYGH